MMNEKNALYTKEHEWFFIEGQEAFVGLSHYAIQEFGPVVFAKLAPVGSFIEAGSALGIIESTKTVSDITSPLSGTILAINEAILLNPKLLSSEPFERCWFVKIKHSSQPNQALSWEQYRQYLEGQSVCSSPNC